MSSFEITLEGILCNEECTDDEVSATFDAVMEALVDLGAQDPFVGGSLADRRVEIAAVIEAPTPDVAVAEASLLFNSALARAGLELQTTPTAITSLAWSSTSIRPAV